MTNKLSLTIPVDTRLIQEILDQLIKANWLDYIYGIVKNNHKTSYCVDIKSIAEIKHYL